MAETRKILDAAFHVVRIEQLAINPHILQQKLNIFRRRVPLIDDAGEIVQKLGVSVNPEVIDEGAADPGDKDHNNDGIQVNTGHEISIKQLVFRHDKQRYQQNTANHLGRYIMKYAGLDPAITLPFMCF
jgi:hypothetical protein